MRKYTRLTPQYSYADHKKTCSPVERVSVVGDKDVGLHLQKVVKEPSQQIVLGEDGSHVIHHDVIESGSLHIYMHRMCNL